MEQAGVCGVDGLVVAGVAEAELRLEFVLVCQSFAKKAMLLIAQNVIQMSVKVSKRCCPY